MSDFITIEVRFFLISILSGIAILVLYDVLRIFRRIVSHHWFFVALEDILFWMISGVFIFAMMYQQNNGTIRGFSILGMLLGMIVYNQSVSPYVVTLISRFFLFLNRMIGRILLFCYRPIRFVCKHVKNILGCCDKKWKQICKILLNRLKREQKEGKIKHKNNPKE